MLLTLIISQDQRQFGLGAVILAIQNDPVLIDIDYRHGLHRQPRDRRVMHAKGFGDGAEAFASLHTFSGLGLLMGGELGIAAELGTALDGGDPAFVCALEDPVALLLGEAA